MALRKYQEEVDSWIKGNKWDYWPPMEMLARVTEEVGELAREMNHIYGSKKKKPTEPENDLGVEICDIIFCLICIANLKGIDLDESFSQMMKKYTERDKNRY